MNNSADKIFSGDPNDINNTKETLRFYQDMHNSFTISIDQKKYYECSPDFLCDFIINIHHKYIRNAFPEIISICKALVGKKKSESFILKDMQELMHDFEFHMRKEEKLLFPYIKKMCRVINDKTEYETPPFGSVSNLVKVLEKEHCLADRSFLKIRKLFTNSDSEVKDRIIKKKLNEYLNEFIADFHSHIILERNILFPKAVSLEKKLKKNSKTLNHK